MDKLNSQLKSPISAVLFDCDGTLSKIEGIDVLAEHNNVGDKVSALTAQAMTHSGINEKLYADRLDLVRPTLEQVVTLGAEYFANRTQDSFEVIQFLQQLNKEIYIISAGLYPAVALFADALNIPRDHVFAVNMQFDEAGHYLDFDHTSPLVHPLGKRKIVEKIKQQHHHIAYVGDGLNDYEAADLATRFIGYGGQFYRENIAAVCEYYLTKPSMRALLPLCLTPDELKSIFYGENKLT